MSLTNNTSALESLLNTANALPEAGTTVETCEVTITGESSSFYPINIVYTSVDGNGNIIGASQAVSTSSVTVTCVRGSILVVEFKSSLNTVNDTYTNIDLLFNSYYTAAFKLHEDAKTAGFNNKSGHSGGSND